MRRRQDLGFTLVEVMAALLVGMIGLLGTVAVQMTVLRGTQNVGDAMVALRLCTQKAEEFDTAITNPGPPVTDRLAALYQATGATSDWAPAEYLDASGLRNSTATALFRFTRTWQVTNSGVGRPYNLVVRVSYTLDTGAAKVVEVDLQRTKSW